MKTFSVLVLGIALVLLGRAVHGDPRPDSFAASSWALEAASAAAPGGHAPAVGPVAWAASGPERPAAPVPPEDLQNVVARYCVICHSGDSPPASLSLAEFQVDDPLGHAEAAEKVIQKLRAGMMPPRGMPRPGGDTLQALVEHLETTLDRVAGERPDPGRRTFQRLTRVEYARAVRELLGLDVDVEAFLPAETLSQNFDNIADVQNLSAALMEGYLRAAAHIARVAVGDPEATTSQTTYKVEKTLSQVGHVEGTPVGTRGGTAVLHNFPADGEYAFKLEFHPGPTGFLYGMTTAEPEKIEVSIDGERVALLEVDRWMHEQDPTGMRIETPRIHVRAGPRQVAAAFVQTFEGPVSDLLMPVDYTLADSQIGGGYGVTTLPHLRDFAIQGPFKVTGISDTPSRRRIFTCRPTSQSEEGSCAREIVTRLAREAYRRPLDRDDVEGLMAFYELGAGDGGFELGIRTALQAILASPHFVLRVEELPRNVRPGQSYPIGGLDLASRLSFFLWALPPDEALVELGRSGELLDPRVLERETRRMLADPRSEALATRFAYQWLRLQDVEKIHPDAQLFPYWDHSLQQAMLRETELFFWHLVQEDGSLFELLTGDHTFVNERLARHYGIPNVSGTAFRRVPLQGDMRRGLLGHASVLTMTSHADRTSPVLRGKWVLEVLMGTPPPPPPPNVPDLEATDGAAEGRTLTTRERMEAHRANPACMSCHVVIDPLGLALDNFDVTGALRIRENGSPVDTRGELYDGTPLEGPADLRQALLARPSVFVRTFTRNLMAYALGRRVEYYDMPTVRAIERDAAQQDHRMSAFILGVVNSPAFRMSTAEVAQGDS